MSNRIRRQLWSSAIALFLLFATLPHIGADSKEVVVRIDTLNVRQGPSTIEPIVAKIHKGEKYSIIGQAGDWFEIQLPSGETGWVAAWLVEIGEQHGEEKERLEVTASILNVRLQPDIGAPLVGKLKKQQIVTANKKVQDWYYIETESFNGWIHQDYVAKIEAKNDALERKSAVIASILNVRAEPSLESERLYQIKKGDTVLVREDTGEWSRIEYNGKSGWVASQYLRNSSLHAEQTEQQLKLTTLHNRTNIRKGPSTTTDVVKQANKGETYTVLEKADDWYKVKLHDGSEGFIAKWLVVVSDEIPIAKADIRASARLHNKTIVIDPGHGGKDHGATGVTGTAEKAVTFQTATLLAEKLENAGANVILTRKSDRYVTLQQRVSIAHTHQADAFISIHYDSVEDSSVQGITTFYFNSADLALAKALHSQLLSATEMKDRQIQFGNYHVIRENKQPSVLLELGFLSNKHDESYVNTAEYQEKATTAIAKGLEQFFQ